MVCLRFAIPDKDAICATQMKRYENLKADLLAGETEQTTLLAALTAANDQFVAKRKDNAVTAKRQEFIQMIQVGPALTRAVARAV